MRPRLLLSIKLLSIASRRGMHAGEIVAGRKAHYKLTKALQEVNSVPTIFEAEVLQNERHLISAHRVIIKTAAPKHEASRDGLIREYNTYNVHSVAKSKYIRTMYDVVGEPTDLNDEKRNSYPGLVLEWFDITLQDIPPDRYRHNMPLLHAIVCAVLSSSATFHSENLVNTDIKPDNVLISNFDTGRPVVKIGDLGSVHDDGEVYECQPFAMRAPEVWRGLACTHKSEVWALAAMLLVWMNPGLLGISGINGYITAPIWSIAKLMLLFPEWKGPPANKEFRREEFEIAEMLSKEPDAERPGEKRVKVASLEEEMQTMQIPVELRDILRYLLNPEPESRPSALEALASEEYLALRKAASKSISNQNCFASAIS